MRRFDVFPKTHDDLKVRTLGGAAISVCCYLFAFTLFISEFRQWRSLETVDMLDVDTTARPDGKLPVNIDIYLPSLPCAELVTEVTDDSGSQQLAVTDTLHKLRMDHNGIPLDLPEKVDWSHVVAPAFQQRKVVRLMEDAQQHLAETIGHLEHELEENPQLTEEEHHAHRALLAEQVRNAPLLTRSALAAPCSPPSTNTASPPRRPALSSPLVDLGTWGALCPSWNVLHAARRPHSCTAASCACLKWRPRARPTPRQAITSTCR